MASINLRALIDNVLRDTSDDLREQCNIVNQAFAKRLEELNDAKSKLENHLQKVRIVGKILLRDCSRWVSG